MIDLPKLLIVRLKQQQELYNYNYVLNCLCVFFVLSTVSVSLNSKRTVNIVANDLVLWQH